MRVPSLLLPLLTLAVAGPVRAEPSPYRLRLSLDLPALAIAGGLSASALVELPAPACLPTCDASRINAFDRGVVGNYSESLHTAADWLVLSALLLPPIIDALDSGGDGWVEDTLVFAEAVLVAQGLTQVTKAAVRRSAPFVYDPAVPLELKQQSADAPRSFFSGHTATAFAAATSFGVTYWLRHPDSVWRWVVLGMAELLAAGVGLLKIGAGYHFPTDVLAAAAVGVGVGVLIPLLHVAEAPESD